MNKIIKTPTGHIVITECEDDTPIECLSLGDYGKEQNIKAQFLGLSRDIEFVPHGPLLPLEEKWVITLSSQKGCSMGCTFCDVPKVGPGRNASVYDLLGQFDAVTDLHPEVSMCKRINLHYARMGEPTFNEAIFEATAQIKTWCDQRGHVLHPVISTMMPYQNKNLFNYLVRWMVVKNDMFGGEAGLQLSINSTDANQRDDMFRGYARSLWRCAQIMKDIIDITGVKGRKIALNFALAQNTIIDAPYLARLFDPEHFMVKITPLHETSACQTNNLHTPEGYTSFTPYREHEQNLVEAGFDTLIFIPSREEDESRITCGNAILADNNE